ncbi:putative uncharacterized protein YHR045W [Aspergillus awamori]|uniref:Contig An07c0080, genomic contig n=7 Tax=Aspergillus TaxID=5052 RepID=A2QMV4_ASPNC|nr:uncharacterized protein An07g03440 [Aspergillus niger]XP_025460710.1 uncharacterized protein BO96DRAFT_407275 [Aspergillus niger CBS 101883]XP_026626659.1 hypothetical protein BDQ94DRAFT_31860 [Aspergillus welwitschiae]EHA23898.1 hypothetical protein ASPNIDRAFT_56228 [Aspergillus niger ATCC 1015]RDH16658.1 hypothetical protein M747DRAFT_298641 [Aspergillus niger ATCC 13496]RDK39449.1 hypothetical protein M752DRAFT_278428 [Aspergillus phoenicis ATCC 13157]GCB17389.1 putative uncharacterized|eukprot:XP_001391427.1 hypothetical protein ANI_1_428064 [Aspergillus niger CBS 513.88]
MDSNPSIVAKLDAFVAELLADWNIYTTLIAGGIVAFLVFSFVTSKDSDIHPFLLARQSTAFPVRQPGETAQYRSLETPHGFPLRSGLNVKDPGAPRWTSGRKGDLRDVWKAAVRGAVGEDGKGSGKQGKIYTVLGRKAIEHSLEQVTQEINVIGSRLQSSKVNTVAICLTDSVELLAAIFAGAFYGLKTIIIPHNLEAESLSTLLKESEAEALIAEAGALDLSLVAKGNDQLSQVIWVAKLGSRHMDWNDVPEDVKGTLEVNVWHELVEEKKDLAGLEVPSWDPSSPAPSLTTVWPSKSSAGEFIEYQSENLVAGIAGIMFSLPRPQRLSSNDLVLSIDSLSRSYPLCQIMAALYSNASVALNSVAGESVDFALATVGLSPTVIIASSRTMSEYHSKFMKPHSGFISLFSRWIQVRSLDSGYMPSHGVLNQVANVGPTAELSLDKLRLLCISHRVDADREAQLDYEQLADLRILTGARVVYALTGPGVAGAVFQTNVFDYRRFQGSSHFGAPLSSVEVVLTGVSGDEANEQGQITVSGPSVISGKTTLEGRARIRDDNTFELLP